MADHLIERYNAALAAIQDREAADLDGALTIYVNATKTITDRSAAERLEVGIAHAAAMRQRDHEYHNGRTVEMLDPPPTTLPVSGAGFVSRNDSPIIWAHIPGASRDQTDSTELPQ
jgi:hypothetical protein